MGLRLTAPFLRIIISIRKERVQTRINPAIYDFIHSNLGRSADERRAETRGGRFHPRRIISGYRHHRRSCRLAPARHSSGAGMRRSLQCKNNLRQLGIASHAYELSYKCYPSLGRFAPINGISWSVHAKLLPFIEENGISKQLDFKDNADNQPFITQQRINTFLCPSERNDKPYDENGMRFHFPLNYAFCYGTWFVYDPVAGQGGDGAIAVNGQLQAKNIRDGLHSTVYIAEVKAWTAYYRDGGSPDALGTPAPTTIEELTAYCSGGQLVADPSRGHTEWVDSRIYQTGFTTACTPNSKVMFEGRDIDFVSSREGRSDVNKTFAAVTSRSYHPGIVNILLLDASVRSVSSEIDLALWRALGTRANGDIVGNF